MFFVSTNNFVLQQNGAPRSRVYAGCPVEFVHHGHVSQEGKIPVEEEDEGRLGNVARPNSLHLRDKSDGEVEV